MKIQKITNILTTGQIKLYMGHVNKNPNQNFDFEYAKLTFVKKIASAKKIKKSY